MKTINIEHPINLKVVRFELDFSNLVPQEPDPKKKPKKKSIRLPKDLINVAPKKRLIPPPPIIKDIKREKCEVKDLVDQLLNDIYADHRDWSTGCSHESTSAGSIASSHCGDHDPYCIERSYLEALKFNDLRDQVVFWHEKLRETGERLARCVKTRDRLRRQQKRICGAFSVLLRHITGDPNARFGVAPGAEGPGEGGFVEWLHAMRLVARLPAGVPQHFRRKLWLTLADRHLAARGIEWSSAERACFRGTAQPDDTELGAQILKDLHRTGCSLFCGTEGRENQAMLRRVLLAYARWNKEVGYCQGFNMLAAIIIEVMDKSESDSLKVMIYLVEAVLPEGYFADDLRGLSADMAAFRDLLRLRIPRLANHMDHLQRISDGGGVEPPLPDVFTMQWFLTLYATWLPRESLLRIWDLVLLDGNEILLLTALGIWDILQDRILSARSADEFYSCMGGGAGAVWEAGEALVARVVAFGSVPELPRLRSMHRYRVAPPVAPASAPVNQPPMHSAMQTMTKKGLRLFYSEDEGDSSDDGNKMALATVIPRREDRSGAGDRLSLDIGALKRQYARLRERQRQAHVILAAACARHAAVGVPTSPTSLTVNNLLLGKSAIVSSRGRRLGPPVGAIPPSRQAVSSSEKEKVSHSKQHTNETISWNEEKSRKSISRRNSVKWKDIKKEKDPEKPRKASIDFDEAGDGIIVSEHEANQIVATMRSRSLSESSSYSSHTASSTDTSLCDENERLSDSDHELPEDEKDAGHKSSHKNKISPLPKRDKVPESPIVSETISSQPTHSPITNFTLDTTINFTPNTDSQGNITDEPVKDISDYLVSVAGEPLRTYIDGFEAKLKDTLNLSSSDCLNKPISPFKSSSPYSSREPLDKEVVETLDVSQSDVQSEKSDVVRPTNFSPITFKGLSPLELSPCNYSADCKAPYNYDYLSNFKRPSPSRSEVISRPDIIDSLTMYPNFVPDIDLSERNVSDVESLPQSPGAESIIVSEDEPPIPLKIDKYFEHSPDFFGARVTDPNNADIPNRRAAKRYARLPKKPDSLTLQSSYNEKLLLEDESERASSLPQSHSFSLPKEYSHDVSETLLSPRDDDENIRIRDTSPTKSSTPLSFHEFKSPKEYIMTSGRKNSERALQIIQENSKILNRILTKQNVSDTSLSSKLQELRGNNNASAHQNTFFCDTSVPRTTEMATAKLIDSPILRESTSDSLIRYRKRIASCETNDVKKPEYNRIRPISIDDPSSLDSSHSLQKYTKTPSAECLANKTDLYGWENKGFLVKCEYGNENILNKSETKYDYDFRSNISASPNIDLSNKEPETAKIEDWSKRSFSRESKTSVTFPSTETQDISDRKPSIDDYNYPHSSKYNDYVLSKASDICSKTVDQGPKICDNLLKTENSQVSDFAHVVTSSISFTYEASAEDDSPIGAKSNSSDTLCQITSLDQISTPISPKIFPNKETPSLPKDCTEKSDKVKLESDDTCSAITSLVDTDTLSSISYPRSPSTGSYHPFPTRPSLRMPKELGVRLGMYPKDTVGSPQK